MFRPDGNALPRWVGNLKQYQFVYDQQQDTLQLADASLTPAVSPTTGFIDEEAASFWTHSSDFWINVETASSGRYSRSDAPDGEKVEKGGVAQLLREAYFSGAAARTVYTCPGTSCGNDVDLSAVGNSYQFSTANGALNPVLFGFGATETGRRDDLVNWIRGEDNIGPDNVGNESIAKDQLGQRPSDARVRPSIHGDVLHSRPIAINYGGSRGVVVFYGTNDGVLRAVNGNQTGYGAGSELWAFVAPEHFPGLNRLRENDPEVRYPSTPSANIDGPRARLLLRRPDRRVSEHRNRRGGAVCWNAARRPFDLCLRRQQSVAAPPDVGNRPRHERLCQPRTDLVDAARVAHQGPG